MLDGRPDEPTHPLRLGRADIRCRSAGAFGVILEGPLDRECAHPRDWLHELLADSDTRDDLFSLVDTVGLVVCLNVATDHPSYRAVRGRSSRGRLSQGEYYHHDGCSSLIPPRIVEIRCPHQAIRRHTRTAIAPFPDTVVAMLEVVPDGLGGRPEVEAARELAAHATELSRAQWDRIQGEITRLVRHALPPSAARAYFDAVDTRVGAYRAPWSFGESRLIANHNLGRTMQHRRAYLDAPGSIANGHLVKRWPAEEIDAPNRDEDGSCCAH